MNQLTISDFMDALCDPRAFLSAQEKRNEQLKALGIEENDISKDVIESKGVGGGAGDKVNVCWTFTVDFFQSN